MCITVVGICPVRAVHQRRSRAAPAVAGVRSLRASRSAPVHTLGRSALSPRRTPRSPRNRTGTGATRRAPDYPRVRLACSRASSRSSVARANTPAHRALFVGLSCRIAARPVRRACVPATGRNRAEPGRRLPWLPPPRAPATLAYTAPCCSSAPLQLSR
jgi:hypothetical protein